MQGHATAHHDDPSLRPVSISISAVAVLVALVSLLGHRAHNRTILVQNETIAQWVYYESKATGRTSYDAMLDFLPLAQVINPASAQDLRDKYQKKIQQSDQAQQQLKTKADALEHEVAHQETSSDRFDIGDVCLEASLVIMSTTLLTKRRLYWGIGLALAGVGMVTALTGLFLS
jgi:hypothetical protein